MTADTTASAATLEAGHTPPDMATAPAQAVFDFVLDHLRRQGVAANAVSGTCLYRAEGGRKCAVGCLISDADYSPRMEAQDVLSLNERGFLNLDAARVDFLDRLQVAHDRFMPGTGPEASMSAWETRMAAIADDLDLTYRAPSTGPRA